jgi:hypothetical protein
MTTGNKPNSRTVAPLPSQSGTTYPDWDYLSTAATSINTIIRTHNSRGGGNPVINKAEARLQGRRR